MTEVEKMVGHIVFGFKFSGAADGTSFIALKTATTGQTLFSGIVDDRTALELREIAELIDAHGPHEVAQ